MRVRRAIVIGLDFAYGRRRPLFHLTARACGIAQNFSIAARIARIGVGFDFFARIVKCANGLVFTRADFGPSIGARFDGFGWCTRRTCCQQQQTN